jgi:hypothetical protein
MNSYRTASIVTLSQEHFLTRLATPRRLLRTLPEQVSILIQFISTTAEALLFMLIV